MRWCHIIYVASILWHIYCTFFSKKLRVSGFSGLWNRFVKLLYHTHLPWQLPNLHPECHWSMTGSLELGTAGTTSSTTPAVAGASPLLPSQGTGSLHEDKLSNFTRWWFQRFFIFTPIWGRFPSLLTFFRWVGTTNQFTLSKSIVD